MIIFFYYENLNNYLLPHVHHIVENLLSKSNGQIFARCIHPYYLSYATIHFSCKN